jgi:hypothetical protein
LHWKWSCSRTCNNGGFTFKNTVNTRHNRQKMMKPSDHWWNYYATALQNWEYQNQVCTNTCEEITCIPTICLWMSYMITWTKEGGLVLQMFSTLSQCKKILFSHECAIYRSRHPRNIAFCGKGNLYFSKETENNPPHVMIC